MINLMKMSPQCFASLQADILTVAKAKCLMPLAGRPMKDMFDLLAWVSHNRSFDASHPAYERNPSFRILPHDGRSYTWYYQDNGGLNDSHVATALRHIRDNN
jgi:hypothetical protein